MPAAVDAALPLEPVLRRVSLRLLPLLFALYLFAYLDRTNTGIAALQMNGDLGFGPAVFGFGAGIFFLGYALCEIPSNLMLVRFGARRWIARIAITWGLLTCLTACVHTPLQFHAARFLLGAAEAGLFPGVVFYLSRWYPDSHRARALSAFTMAIPLALVLGGPVGGALLGLRGVAGLAGWQWLFLFEGLPPVVLGAAALVYLTERPEDARWLETQARQALAARLAASRAPDVHALRAWRGLSNPLAWLLTVPFFAYLTCGLAYVFWSPTIVRETLGTRDAVTGLVSGGISLFGAVAMPLAARLADRLGEHCRVAAFGLGLQVAGAVALALLPPSRWKLLALAAYPLASACFLPAFWTLPSRFLEGPAAAAGIALINAVGSTGGFAGPYLVGLARSWTGSDARAFTSLALLAAIGAGICLRVRTLPSLRASRPSSE